MIAAILVLFLMPIVDLSRLRGNAFKPFSKIAFAIFAVNFLLLMWLGSQHVESPYVEIGQICTAYYFAHFLIIIPAISVFENTLMDVALSDNDNNKVFNTVNLSVVNTPIIGGIKINLLAASAKNKIIGVRSYSMFNEIKKRNLTYYKLTIKEFILGLFKEIRFIVLNPLISFKNFFSLCISNIKYIFVFKNYSVSLILASLCPRLAVYSADYSTNCLTNSAESSLYFFFFYFGAFVTYFLFILALYQSILLVLFAFKKGTIIQKVIAIFIFYNSLSYVLAIINYFFDLNYLLSKYIL